MNASILSQSGGPCVCTTDDLCVSDTVYLTCVEEVRHELITTTAAISALASAAMGLIANLPIGMAPGLGMNAYVSGSTPIALMSLFSRTWPENRWLTQLWASTALVS